MEHPLSQFKYCPKCGSIHFEINNEKSKRCADCGFVYYFNPSAATVALIMLHRVKKHNDINEGKWIGVGGHAEGQESPEECLLREVKEETGMEVNKAEYLFSLPNIYVYSGFPVHTLDLFFRCTVADTLHYKAMDDAADLFFIPLKEIRTEDFGLGSIRKGLGIFLKEMSE